MAHFLNPLQPCRQEPAKSPPPSDRRDPLQYLTTLRQQQETPYNCLRKHQDQENQIIAECEVLPQASVTSASIATDDPERDQAAESIFSNSSNKGTGESTVGEANLSIRRDERQFRDPIAVPDFQPKTFVYPHSSTAIDQAYHSRFREVVEIFRQNTEEHSSLRDNVQYIDYILKLCGISAKASHPSIVVFCRPKEFRRLKPLLTNKYLRYQYSLRRPSQSGECDKPLFNIYFWRIGRPRTLLLDMRLGFPLSNFQPAVLHENTTARPSPMRRSRYGTLCGSVVEYYSGAGSRTSTLGCVVQIGEELYGSTVMHAVPMPSADRLREGLSSDKAHQLGHRLESETFGELVDDDDPYTFEEGDYGSMTDGDEDGSDDERSPLTTSPSPSIDAHDSEAARRGTMETKTEVTVLSPMAEQLASSAEPDLDWSLIHLPPSSEYGSNSINKPDSSTSIFLRQIAETCPADERPVLIVTSNGEFPKGMLQRGISVLGGINGNRLSNVWTVILSNKKCLARGDSGSIVIDAETYSIYGHVIGSNPIGEVYISPFAAIMKQIQQCFPDARVALPNPPSGTLLARRPQRLQLADTLAISVNRA